MPPVAMTYASSPISLRIFVHHAVHHADVTEEDAGLHAVNRVLADHRLGPRDLDTGQLGGGLKECLQGDPDSGHDDPSQVFPFRRDAVKGGRRAEIHDDAGPVDFLVGCHGVDDSVGTHLPGVVHQDGHAGLDPRLDEDRLQTKGLSAEFFEGLEQRRHDTRNRHGVEVLEGKAGRGADVLYENPVLIRRLRLVRADPPVLLKLVSFEHAQNGLGVPDVDDEEHFLPRLADP